MIRIYIASSWRNERQPEVVAALRRAEFEVYDFRRPVPGDDGFRWTEIDPDWQDWPAVRFREALAHPIAQAGFANDFRAMLDAHVCVMVLPCGRSTHLEAGYFVGAGKPLYVLLDEGSEPELMYLMANELCIGMDELIESLRDEEIPEREG